MYTPLLFSKTGVYRGIHYFLIFALKYILWVLVRAVLRLNEAVLTCTHNICFQQKYEKSKKKKNQLKIVIFTAVKNRCILHGRVFVMWLETVKTGFPEMTPVLSSIIMFLSVLFDFLRNFINVYVI